MLVNDVIKIYTMLAI